MNRGISSGQKKTIIIVLGVVIAFLVGTFITSTVVVIKASPDNPLPSYKSKDMAQPLGSAKNPFTILEIVPNVESATVGYLIKGCEPRNLLSIGATDKTDPDSAAAIYADAFASDTSQSSTIGEPIEAYIFKQDQGNIGTVPKSQFTEKYDTYKSESDPGTDKAYSEYGYYTRVTDGTGNYVYDSTKKCFEPRLLGDFTWTSVGEYQYVGLGRGNSSRVMHYLDEGEYKERNYSYNYNNAAGYIGDKAYNYTFNPAGDFVWVGNNNYNNENIFAENQTEMTYVEGNVTKTRPIANAQVGDKLYMTRTEDVYYSYIASEIICNDLLLKNLVNADATGLNYSTQVVTVTPAQLVHPGEKPVEDMTVEEKKAKELIDNADMIMVHNSSTGYKIAKALEESEVTEDDIPQFSSSGASKDLTEKTMEAIIERGSTAKPAAIVFDEDAINIANLGECQYLNRLYEVYNNLGAKLAYNWMSGQKYNVKIKAAETQPNYRNFTTNEVDALGRSNFVYNYIGNDDSWLTTAFADNNKISKTDKNSPAFENMGGGNTMSVAAMLSAVNKEANGYNQPRKLRILEIQPNERYYYDDKNKDSWVYYYLSLFPWFIGNSQYIEDDVTVATMPTYEFIGRNEDPNENYDMILVGNKDPDETNGKLGYNDAGLGNLVYTAVGDLITTFGGDVDDPNENSESYKWHYGIFGGLNADDNIWSWTQNAYTWDRSGIVIHNYWKDWKIYKDYPNFRKAFIYEYYHYTHGENITAGYDWWYEKNPDGGWFANGFPIYACKHGSDANMIGLRYSGNDLTKKKYDQLLDFSNQGPIIVADNLYGNNSDEPNKAVIDQSSFVYQLAKKNTPASSIRKYTHGVGDELNNVKSNMTKYSCTAIFTNDESGKPREYNQNTSGLNYNTQKDTAGNNVLQYHFLLEGDNQATYGVNVYTDSNGNGVFEDCISYEKERQANNGQKGDSEKASEASLTIFDETVKGFVTDGNLKAGHSYIVTRTLSASDVGMVPWKLELYNKVNDSIRFSEIGYTRIQNTKKTTINVLQMNPQPSMQNNATPTVDFSQNATFNRLKQNLPDFNINVTYMSNQDWWRNYGNNKKTKEWKNELMKYDMLIIGCMDSASFTNDETYIYGFNAFVEAGKAVILTHDLVADVTIGMTSSAPHYLTDQMVQSDVRYYLRELLGQMRKYYDAESYATSNNNNYSYMDYKSNGRSLSLKPKDNFKIYTSIHETRHYLDEIYDNYMTLEPHDNYNYTPVYDKFTYVYGNFDKRLDGKSLIDDGTYLFHPDHREMAITSKINYVRDYYTRHGYQPACMIMDNSVRAMFFYNYIYYVEDKKYSPDGKTTGFIDKIDRTVKNVDLNNRDQRRRLVWGGDGFETNRVKKANEGQITKYPFAIDDTINVANTHAQNYQLDLEYDDGGDVLVWYNLIGIDNDKAVDVYGGKNQDSRNNYYIYTKGGITYTGLGHKGNVTENELKLFINTMIAAYRTSASDPYIRVLNEDAVTNGNNTTMYLEDRDIGSDGTIRYRIADDTTNSKIVRTYSLEVYKEGQLIQTIDAANLSTEYTIPVSFSDVKANGEVKYKVILKSTYRNDQGVDVRTESEQNVNVDLMPMFGLR